MDALEIINQTSKPKKKESLRESFRSKFTFDFSMKKKKYVKVKRVK